MLLCKIIHVIQSHNASHPGKWLVKELSFAYVYMHLYSVGRIVIKLVPLSFIHWKTRVYNIMTVVQVQHTLDYVMALYTSPVCSFVAIKPPVNNNVRICTDGSCEATCTVPRFYCSKVTQECRGEVLFLHKPWHSPTILLPICSLAK